MPIKGPLTRRRERRILAAVRACGPLTDLELCYFLRLPTRRLVKPLMNLAATGQITSGLRSSGILTGQKTRIWELPAQEATDA